MRYYYEKSEVGSQTVPVLHFIGSTWENIFSFYEIWLETRKSNFSEKLSFLKICLSFSKICLSFFSAWVFLALSFFRNVKKKASLDRCSFQLDY